LRNLWLEGPRRERYGFPARLLLGLVMVLGLSGCGYHVAGSSDRLPGGWDSIAIPTLVNNTTSYRIEQRFTEAIIREFISRSKYHIVQDTASADGVLRGEVLSIETAPIIFNATTGEVTMMLVTVHTKIELVDNKTKKSVYEDTDMVFRNEYQISPDVKSFFNEQNPAIERLSRDLAARVVSNVLEGF
jgi:outer membrane lipopolysaccharide assembly protein LptE/RlpB